MDLYDIFAGAESFHTRRLLEHARALAPEQLDAPLHNPAHVFPWDSPAQSLRDLLRRLVQTKEIWTAALTGGTLPNLDAEPPEQGTPEALLARLERADARLQPDSRRRAEAQRLERHLRRCVVRAAGDVLVCAACSRT